MSREVELVTVDGLLPNASNFTLLGRDASGGPWVYKPERGEGPLWDFPPGTLWRREVAAYRVSRALGLEVVPETVEAEGPYGPGSAQRFLHEDLGWDPRPLVLTADELLLPVAILDVVCNNADRKMGHLLREPGGTKVWAIDNGLTFHPADKLRTVLWAFAGRIAPETERERLGSPMLSGLEVELAGLLHQVEIEALAERALRLAAGDPLPHPPSDRSPLPWPVW